VEVQEEEEGNKAVKEKNHGSQAGIKMKQKKHNLGCTKNTSNNEEVESEDEALEKALCESADHLPGKETPWMKRVYPAKRSQHAKN
jgi:hypothetical protein